MSDFATTVRLKALVKTSVEAFQTVEKTTLNKLVNDALAFYLGHLAAEKRSQLDQALAAVEKYRSADPDFEHAIAWVAAQEAAGTIDPMDGTPSPGAEPTRPDPTATTEELLDILNAGLGRK